MNTRWVRRRVAAEGVACSRRSHATCALAALVISCTAISACARADEGVPAAAVSAPKSHKQTGKIVLLAAGESGHLEDFCLAADGTVLALVAGDAPGGGPGLVRGTAQVRVFDRDGKPVRSWPVDFAAQAIGSGADGVVYVGGDGRLANYSTTGTPLSTTDAPQIALLKDPEELRQRAKVQLEDEKTAAAEQIRQVEEQLKKVEGASPESKPSSGTKPEPNPAGTVDVRQLLNAQLQALRQWQNRTVDDVVAALTSRLRTINSIAVAERDLFIACPGTKGYGYSVWRMDRDFKEPQEIVTGLVGCCGQMDIQTRDGDLFAAENARHRVVRFNREGERLLNFGSRDREGAGEGFGGCCNPMNLCFTSAGDLLAAESNGLIKHFTLDGKFVGLVGIAEVPEGCKNSAIGMSSDGDRVYYIDIRGSKIVMLARNDTGANAKE